jgi:hypothetical protein
MARRASLSRCSKMIALTRGIMTLRFRNSFTSGLLPECKFLLCTLNGVSTESRVLLADFERLLVFLAIEPSV